ncbi:ABC transporter permease [Magnetospira sp. QH-2]|uniref:ABC transporter permease n=1 Tax=Magnetospira sp. (strain QH-2) TaxID=1288970 RepID=UPI0003E80CF9|nr:ABC transporter permease [Magnetospira sp. QH-2]CCQ74703.1 putative ABC transporter permease protein [Magnetospira sp. QH-2]
MMSLEARPELSRAWVYLSPVLAVVLTMLSGALLFGLLGYAPLAALSAYFIEPVSSLYGLAELGVKATPIVLCAVGLALGFRAGVWNIGAEGQLTLGALGGGGMALVLYEVEGFWVLPVMALGAMVAGMAWASITALLRTRFNTNEILTSLMLVYVSLELLKYLVHGPWRDPDGMNFPESRLFHDAALLPVMLDDTRLHLGALVALVAVGLAWLAFGRHMLGFQLRVIGQAPRAARFAGFSEKGTVWFAMLLTGALAGLAGMFEVAGPVGQLMPTISPGYGFTAIIVAFLGRLHPIGVLLAGLLMALTYLGGENAQIVLNMPNAVTGVFQGLLLFYLLACDLLVRYRLRWHRSEEARP